MTLFNYFQNTTTTPSTAQTYNYSLRKLKELTKSDDIKIIYNTDKTIKAIQTMKTKPQQIAYTAIVAYLKIHDPKNDDLIKFYRSQSNTTQKDINTKRAEQKHDPEKVKNFITMDDLKSTSAQLQKEFKKEQDPQQKRRLFMFRLIVNLYTRIGARLDFADVSILTRSAYDKLNDTDKQKTNFLIIEKNKKLMFVFHHFKNVQQIGVQERPADRWLTTLLNQWLKMNPTKYLLIHMNNNPMTRDDLSKTLKQLFKKYLNKPNARVNSIRHGLITEEQKHAPSLKQQKAQAIKFFHTKTEHQLYRNI